MADSINEKVQNVFKIIGATNIEVNPHRPYFAFTVNNERCSFSVEKGRLIISVHQPRIKQPNKSEFLGSINEYWGSAKTRITVAQDTEDEKIANAIFNRIDWAHIETIRAELQKQFDKSNDYVNNHKALVKEIQSGLTKLKLREKNETCSEVSLYQSNVMASFYGEIVIEGDYAEFRIRSVRNKDFMKDLLAVVEKYSESK